MIHVAAPALFFEDHLRQRCMWCGAVLIDQDLSRIAVAHTPEDRCAICTITRAEHGSPEARAVVPGSSSLRQLDAHEFVFEHTYPTWEVGAYIEHDSGAPGGASWIVASADSGTRVRDLGGECCLMLPMEASA